MYILQKPQLLFYQPNKMPSPLCVHPLFATSLTRAHHPRKEYVKGVQKRVLLMDKLCRSLKLITISLNPKQ